MFIAAGRQCAIAVAVGRILGGQWKQTLGIALFVKKPSWFVVVNYSVSAGFVGLAGCAAAIVRLYVSVIADLADFDIDDPIATDLGDAVRIAAVSRSRVVVVAGLPCGAVHYAISARLVRFAVRAAAVAVGDVAVVANLTFCPISEAITTSADVDAGILLKGTGLSGRTAPVERFA